MLRAPFLPPHTCLRHFTAPAPTWHARSDRSTRLRTACRAFVSGGCSPFHTHPHTPHHPTGTYLAALHTPHPTQNTATPTHDSTCGFPRQLPRLFCRLRWRRPPLCCTRAIFYLCTPHTQLQHYCTTHPLACTHTTTFRPCTFPLWKKTYLACIALLLRHFTHTSLLTAWVAIGS